MPTLEKELKTYETNKATLLASSEGKFVLIHGDQVLGIFAAEEDAVGAGYEKVGLNSSFLVKQIVAIEPTMYLYPRFCS